MIGKFLKRPLIQICIFMGYNAEEVKDIRRKIKETEDTMQVIHKKTIDRSYASTGAELWYVGPPLSKYARGY